MGVKRLIVIGVLGLLILPSPDNGGETSGERAAAGALEPYAVYSMAAGTISDLSGFCDRNSQACVTAGHLLDTAEAKARQSLLRVYQWANDGADAAVAPEDETRRPAGLGDWLRQRPDLLGEDQDERHGSADPLMTGTLQRMAGPGGGGNTLRIDDLIPDWRGPSRQRPA